MVKRAVLVAQAVSVAASALVTAPITAQPPVAIARDGWEAFPQVEYVGGDASQPKKRAGMLVLTDSSLAMHPCVWDGCYDHIKQQKLPYKPEPYYIIPLKGISEVSSSSQVRGPSVGGRIAWGVLATDRTEELFGLVYETATSAEAPVFKTMKAQAGAIEAKVRFRLKKLGLSVPQ